MGRRPSPGADFHAVRTAIGTALRSIDSHVLNEPLPEKIAELVKQLDQQLNQLDEQNRRREVAPGTTDGSQHTAGGPI
jgi:hypothetical protein